jgi:hypothetical protein
MTDADGTAFESLDFVYMPSRDVARDAEYFHAVLGGTIVFTIEAFGTRVAMVELAREAPSLLLADHLEGGQPILVYRVGSLEATMSALEERGWEPAPAIEIPHGPCCSFRAPGGQRIAIYELARPQAQTRFGGRRDF